MWGYPVFVLGAISSFLEPFRGHLSPKIDTVSEELTLKYPHEEPWVVHLAGHTAVSKNPKPSTLNPQPSTLNPQPSTLNPQPSTLNPNSHVTHVPQKLAESPAIR